uniref:Protein kinase domain-containing protein n=1 Tax=Nelumbo nucifera TaxID=4432 RepID=A0A822ZB93_NELNU|nr:TPA_asm: hypothetical protein HUJ06_015042 [Nelumbo nucifera]
MMVASGKHTAEDHHSSDTSPSPKLMAKTPIFGLKLYIVIGICVVCVIAVILVILLSVRRCRNSRKRRKRAKQTVGLTSMVSKEIIDIKVSDPSEDDKIGDTDREGKEEKQSVKVDSNKAINARSRSTESNASGGSQSSSSGVSAENSNIGWGRWYALKELEIATGGFSSDNVIGEGGYGVVFRGVLPDSSIVAVKNLFNNKGQAEKEFKVEVEAIGKVRHKNLVGLVGYCADGPQRMLVYEYVDNGNLEQWLHGDVGPVSPLTWDIRMKIAIGTAKGCDILYYYQFLHLSFFFTITKRNTFNFKCID